MNETYIKVNGQWKYLYRVVDKEGNTIDYLLTEKHDMKAAKRFFSKAILYMPAEPKLVEYAYRVGQDIPSEVDIVTFKKMTDNNIADNNTINASSMETEVQNRPFNSIKQDIDMMNFGRILSRLKAI